MIIKWKLTIIKFIHTVIWIFFNVVLINMAYAVIVNKIDKLVWMGVAFILTEGIVLLIFKTCVRLQLLHVNILI
jgi:hypothetical protein